MSTLKTNLIANLLGKTWTAVMAFAFVPWYIHYLGMEAYGLVGWFTSLQAVLTLLDLGLSTAVNRAIASMAAGNDNSREQRDLLRTLELVNWGIALAIGSVLAGSAPLIVDHWMNAHQLERAHIIHAIQLMGLTLALRWPANLYGGALMGLERQLSLNVITCTAATIANLGMICVLAWWSPTIGAFFTWQASVAAIQTVCTGWWIWRCLPASEAPAQFRWTVIKEQWRFAAGTSGITALGVLLTQTDKIVLSKLLSLESFGLYALATLVASGLSMLMGPVFTAVFPKLTGDIARNDHVTLAEDYHRSCRLMALLIMPPALALACFPEILLRAWTGNAELSQQTAPILAILLIGTALNGLMNIPYALQLANGSTRLGLQFNLVSVVVVVPLVIAGAHVAGSAGAALSWPLLNLAYVVIGMPIIHSRFLPLAQKKWLVHDTGIPIFSAGLAVGICLVLAPPTSTRIESALLVGTVVVITYAVTWLCSRMCSGPLSTSR